MDFAVALPQLHPAPVGAMPAGDRDRGRVVPRLDFTRPVKLGAVDDVQTIFLHFPTPGAYWVEIVRNS